VEAHPRRVEAHNFSSGSGSRSGSALISYDPDPARYKMAQRKLIFISVVL
jgi:hypothetical protein